jgi:hypothetical protein
MAIIATPMAMKARPARLANVWPCGESCCCAACGAANFMNKSNRSIRNPKAMTAMAVRTQARKVRSLAAWSV